MKGIILAGGSGTRLYPATTVINKHLLPIYNKPMVYYPLSTLMLAGVRDVLLISTPEDIGQFSRLLGDGSHMGLSITYAVQEHPRGLAEALVIGREFGAGGAVCLALGDNIFFGHGLPAMLTSARRRAEAGEGATLFASFVQDPKRFGIVECDANGLVLSIEEKPPHPKSNWAATGLYFFDKRCWDFAARVEPSARGELEITSVNQMYLDAGALHVLPLGRGFAWFDAGTYQSFLTSSEFIAMMETRTGLMVGCIEEIAYRSGWITADDVRRFASGLKNTDYGDYLNRIASERVM